MNATASVANLAWLGANAGGYRRFRAALRRVRPTQEAILARYLRRNAGTAFGRAHGFPGLRSVGDFQDRVPLSTYDDYLPYIGRIAAGEESVLTRDPVRLFEPSSGSTRPAKWIPYTAALHAEFRRGVAPWAFDLFSRRPALLGGPAYWSITPAVPRPAGGPSAVPVGFEEDSAYLGGAFKRLVDAALAVPGAVRRIQDMDLFRRVTLLFLLRCRDLRLISVWHPTFLVSLLARLRDGWDGLLGDLENGLSLPDAGIELRPAPSRARDLFRTGPDDPARLWPRLGLISCWGEGHARIHLAEMERLFPGVEIQAKGLLATEAFVSLPFRGRRPLAVTSHFFEFLDADGRPHLAWELREGARYSVVVTTGGGLYRYRLQDRVEVSGFLEGAPCLRFLGKEDRISDLFGEKLSEGFVAEAIGRVLAGLGVRPRFAMLAPETEGGAGRYVLFLQADTVPADLPPALEAALRENPHYDYCVRLGQLAPVRVVQVGDGACERYVEHLVAHGQRLGTIKPSPLSALPGWSEVLPPAGPPAPFRPPASGGSRAAGGQPRESRLQ